MLVATCAPNAFSLNEENNLVILALGPSLQLQPSVILYNNNCKKINLKTVYFSRGGLVVWGYEELMVIVWGLLGVSICCSGTSRFMSAA